MWKRLHRMLAQLGQRLKSGAGERRAAQARARFWGEVRDGQREAEARARRRATDP